MVLIYIEKKDLVLYMKVFVQQWFLCDCVENSTNSTL